MSNNTVFAVAIVGQAASTLAAVVSAAVLAYHGRDGWGWFVFLALCIGCYSLKTKGD